MNNYYYCQSCGATHTRDYQHPESWAEAIFTGVVVGILFVIIYALVVII